MQINVAVTDANNIVCQVVPPQTEVITIDRGVAGNGIVSIVPVTISTFQYLRITYTNGTVQDVGPLTSTAYTATSPITIVGNTISLATVPIASGGTDATTAAGAIQNLLPSYTGNANKRLGLNSGGTALEWVADGGGTVTSIAASGGSTGLTFSGSPITSSGTLTLGGTLAVASGGTGATTAADARTNLSAAFNAITISAGTGLTGGGDLTANRTLSIDSSVVTLTGTQTLTNKTLTSPRINEILDTNGNEILGLSPTASATDFVTIKNGIGVGVPLHIYADGSSASIGLHIQPKGTGLVTISDGTDFNKGIRFRSSGSAASAVTLLDAVSTAGRVVTLPDATTTLVGRDTTDTLTNKTIAFASNTFTGALPIANGGTGQTTANAALNALLPTQTGNASKYLQTDGTNATWDAISLSTADITGILPTANGGTGLSSFTANGVVYASSTSALTTGSALSFDASTLKLAANNTSYRGQLTIEGGASDFAQITFYRGSTTNTDQVGYLHSSNSGSTGIALGARNGAILRFEVGDSERARITASGELLVGRTSSSGLGQIQSTIGADLATDSGSVYLVRGGGNVGIGTSSATEKLTINGGAFRVNASNGADGVLSRPTVDGNPFALVFEKTRNGGAVVNGDGLGIMYFRGYDGTNNQFTAAIGATVTGTVSAGNIPTALVFQTSSASFPSERVRITASGDVGIGTSSPTTKLDVIGGVRVGGMSGATGNKLYFDTTSGAGANTIGTVNNYDLRIECGRGATSSFTAATNSLDFQIGGSEVGRFTSTGLGIGTSNPAYKLDIKGGTPFVNLQATVAGSLASPTLFGYQFAGYEGTVRASIQAAEQSQDTFNSFLTFSTYGGGANTERVRITSSGELLVGTTTLASGFSTYAQIEASGTTGGVLINSGASQIGRLIFTNGNTSGNEGLIRYDGSNNSMQFWANAGERARITSDGNLLVGLTSNPANTNGQISVKGDVGVSIAFAGNDRFTDGSRSIAYYGLTRGGTSSFYSGDFDVNLAAYGGLGFYTEGSLRARIDSSGNLLVGTTSILDGNSARIAVGFTYPRTGMEFQSTTSSSLYQITFRNTSTGLVGSITSDTTSTSYNTSSDYRLKNTIAPMTGALAKIALLKPCTYKWNANGADGEGFVAHELAEVFPQAVSGKKDAVDSNGNIKPQGIDTSFLVATLTAAIQEQQAIIESLKARLDAANL
jgi:hypothetical protein